MGVDTDPRVALRRAIQAPSPPRAALREAELVVVADPVGGAPIRLLDLDGARARRRRRTTVCLDPEPA